MTLNEDEEDEDEPEIKTNTVSPYGTQSAQTSDSDAPSIGDDALKGFLNGINGYGDDASRTTSSTMNDFDYSYDAEVVVKEDEDEYEETGSVQFHSDAEEDDEENGGGSVQYNSSMYCLNIFCFYVCLCLTLFTKMVCMCLS